MAPSFRRLVVLVGILLLAATAVRADAPAPLQRGYQIFIDATNKHDAAGALALLAPDYTWTSRDGYTLDREDFDKTFTQSLSRIVRLEVTIEGVAVTSDATIATVTWREAYDDAGTTRVYIERDREEWHVVDGAWKIWRTNVLDTSRADASVTPR
ncbi:MAG: nuclear transport factor 2 family protein [Candidatus Xenobia bacterium]